MSTLPLYDMKPSPIASWSALDENKTLQKTGCVYSPRTPEAQPENPELLRAGRWWWWPVLISGIGWS